MPQFETFKTTSTFFFRSRYQEWELDFFAIFCGSNVKLLDEWIYSEYAVIICCVISLRNKFLDRYSLLYLKVSYLFLVKNISKKWFCHIQEKTYLDTIWGKFFGNISHYRYCSLPLRRVHEIKRMQLAPRTHALFIT